MPKPLPKRKPSHTREPIDITAQPRPFTYDGMKQAMQPPKVEVIPPNFAAAYAALAPLVAQAWAYKDAGDENESVSKLKQAIEVIEQFSEQCLNPSMQCDYGPSPLNGALEPFRTYSEIIKENKWQTETER